MKIPRFPGLFRNVYPGKEMAHLFGQDGANQSFAILQKIEYMPLFKNPSEAWK